MKTKKTHYHPALSTLKGTFTSRIETLVPKLRTMTFEQERAAMVEILSDPKLPMSTEARKKYDMEMGKQTSKPKMEKWICDKMLAGDNLMVI